MFEVGKEYNRREEIHGKYGGNWQSGICTPKNKPYIFIFTSEKAESHGYQDRYGEDGLFYYTGSGQKDMEFKRGNKAIYKHRDSKNPKDIHLFKKTRTGYARYIGEVHYVKHHKEDQKNDQGEMREAIVFGLRVDSVLHTDEKNQNMQILKDMITLDCEGDIEDNHKVINDRLEEKTIHELRMLAMQKRDKSLSAKQSDRAYYVRSQAIKRYVLKRAEGKCEGCKNPAPFESSQGPFLECHHIHCVADSGPDMPQNVVALCPNCHRRAHYAIERQSFNKQLKEFVVFLEESFDANP